MGNWGWGNFPQLFAPSTGELGGAESMEVSWGWICKAHQSVNNLEVGSLCIRAIHYWNVLAYIIFSCRIKALNIDLMLLPSIHIVGLMFTLQTLVQANGYGDKRILVHVIAQTWLHKQKPKTKYPSKTGMTNTCIRCLVSILNHFNMHVENRDIISALKMRPIKLIFQWKISFLSPSNSSSFLLVLCF